MKRGTIKRSISFRPELATKAAEKAEKNGQSFSSYINVLIAADLHGKEKRKAA